jgi:hypothetical protein
MRIDLPDGRKRIEIASGRNRAAPVLSRPQPCYKGCLKRFILQV